MSVAERANGTGKTMTEIGTVLTTIANITQIGRSTRMCARNMRGERNDYRADVSVRSVLARL